MMMAGDGLDNVIDLRRARGQVIEGWRQVWRAMKARARARIGYDCMRGHSIVWGVAAWRVIDNMREVGDK